MMILHGQHTVDAVVKAGKEAYDRLLKMFTGIYGEEKGKIILDRFMKARQQWSSY